MSPGRRGRKHIDSDCSLAHDREGPRRMGTGGLRTLGVHPHSPLGSTRQFTINGRDRHKTSARLIPQRKRKRPESVPH